MKTIIINWLKRYFCDPEAALLFVFIVIGMITISTLSHMLAPLFTSIVIAYLLEWCVSRLQKLKIPHVIAVLITFVIFIAVVMLILVGVLPLLSRQLTNFITEMPDVVANLQVLFEKLREHFPLITDAQIQHMLLDFKLKIGHYGQVILATSITFIPNIAALVVYLVMVPILVYFFLMDKIPILHWLEQRFIPKKRRVLNNVWQEVHVQIGNYIRGKVFEAIIVMLVTYIMFLSFGLQYSLLLASLVGFSVFIPYIGIIVVTIPIIIVALLQWGWSSHFLYLIIAYAIVVALEANVLVPLLFAEAVALHPVAIIIAILIFGGIWGFWGIFFAIPLATLVKAIIYNWPVTDVALRSTNDYK